METMCTGGACPFSEISWLWYAVSVVLSFAIGGLWYGKLFTKAWTQAVKFECPCGADYSKGEKCTCKPQGSYYLTMLLQFVATALVGLMYFVLSHICPGLAVLVAIAIAGWMKATLKFQIQETKRWMILCGIDIGYFAIVSTIMILFALI